MVFSAFGLETTEAELRALCDCTIFGTDALKAVDAARQLGFAKTIKSNLSFDDLVELTASGYFPIVYVDLRPIQAQAGFHALVIVEVGQSRVAVYDPAVGERQLPRSTFVIAWALQQNLAIIVQK